MKKNKVLIIAEAGVNHNGDIKLAYKLIDKAVEAGADIVKFQTFRAENLVSKQAPKAEYQKKLTNSSESQFEMIKKLELDLDTHKKLITHCEKRGIYFLSTPFDLESIDLICSLNIKLIKIPSGEITNLPYLRKVGKLKGEVILSSGMSNLGEIEAALNVLIEAGTKKENISVLHCNTEYPTPFADVNLKAMVTIGESFGVKVGYSDHTKGIEISIAAVALGAEIIEKHFTLDKNMPGPDHKASLEPDELKAMVNAIRNVEEALGNGIKKPSTSEIKNMAIARKSIIAMKNIKKGEIFNEKNITTKRPGNGISPMLWDIVLGQKACRGFKADELISLK